MPSEWVDERLKRACPAPGSRVEMYGRNLGGATGTVQYVRPDWNEELEKAAWLSPYAWGWTIVVELDDHDLLDERMRGVVDNCLSQVRLVSGDTVDPRSLAKPDTGAFDADFEYVPVAA